MKKERLSNLPRYFYAPLIGHGNENDNEIFLAYNQNLIWEEMADIFRKLKIRLAFHIGMPFWQTEVIYHKTCRAVPIPDCMGNIYNLPLALKLLRDLKMEAVVTTGSIFKILLPYLIKNRENIPQLRLWYFYGEPIAPEIKEEIHQFWPDTETFQYFNPFPPVPLGYQCRYLAGQINRFHPPQKEAVKINFSPENEILMTIQRPIIAKSLSNYPTGYYGRIRKKSCPCGRKQIFEVEI